MLGPGLTLPHLVNGLGATLSNVKLIWSTLVAVTAVWHIAIWSANVIGASCRLLDLPIRYLDRVLAVVLACKNEQGGFARPSGALPNIELNRREVDIIVDQDNLR